MGISKLKQQDNRLKCAVCGEKIDGEFHPCNECGKPISSDCLGKECTNCGTITKSYVLEGRSKTDRKLRGIVESQILGNTYRVVNLENEEGISICKSRGISIPRTTDFELGDVVEFTVNWLGAVKSFKFLEPMEPVETECLNLAEFLQIEYGTEYTGTWDIVFTLNLQQSVVFMLQNDDPLLIVYITMTSIAKGSRFRFSNGFEITTIHEAYWGKF